MAYKTNVMRLLDKGKIAYRSYSYEDTEAVSGEEVAEVLNLDPKQLFKTLVTVGKSKDYYVFLVPVSEELDLKKASNSVNEKSIQMIKSKDLLSLTGYVHGGCSPIGMKRNFKIVIDESAEEYKNIIFNAGKIGYQVEIKLADLANVIDFKLDSIV